MLMQGKRVRQARGFTLTEAAVVLGIIGMILGAVWVAAGSVYDGLRNKRANEEMLSIVQGVRSLFASSGTTNTTNNMNADLIKARIIPADMVTSTTTISNPWGGAVDVVGQQISAAGDAFSVSFAAVPQAACARVVMAVGGRSRDPGLLSVALTTASVNNGVPVSNEYNLAAANTLCANATNTVVFTFLTRAS